MTFDTTRPVLSCTLRYASFCMLAHAYNTFYLHTRDHYRYFIYLGSTVIYTRVACTPKSPVISMNSIDVSRSDGQKIASFLKFVSQHLSVVCELIHRQPPTTNLLFGQIESFENPLVYVYQHRLPPTHSSNHYFSSITLRHRCCRTS